MSLGFVLTNYNNSKFTKGAIQSVLDSDSLSSPIIIVDNGSKTEHVEQLQILEKMHKSVIIIYNEDNVGYFKGLNVGIEFGREKYSDIKYWVVGNNDLVFSKYIKSEISSCKDVIDEYPVVSPNIVTVNGVQQNPHVIYKIGKFREFIYDIYHFNYYFAIIIKLLASFSSRFTDRNDELQYEIAQEIYQGYGACYILTPVFFTEFKELWSPTFLMYEEFFLSMQLQEKGYKTFYQPTIKVMHHWHATVGELPNHFRWKLCRDAHKEYRKYVKVWRE